MGQNLEKMLFEPAVSHRFLVSLFIKWIPSPLDIRFQRISGLGMGTLGTSLHPQGGSHADNIFLPERVTHPHLVLERGVIAPTLLTADFEWILQGHKGQYINAVILLMNHANLPVCSWTITDALPVKWETGELNASSNAPLINHIELIYRNIYCLGAKI